MVSRPKRMRYVSEEYSSDESEIYSPDENKNNSSHPNSGRKPKCFSKNALMARENRLKKKLYVQNLEGEVSGLKKETKKLSTVIDNQSFLIKELKNEVKYLKSVLANSSDISKLLRNIHQNTGMSVSTSLDKQLSLKKKTVLSKPQVPIARKTAHPWEETKIYPNYPTPESFGPNSDDFGLSDMDLKINDLDVFNIDDIPLNMLPENNLLDDLQMEEYSDVESNTNSAFIDHNYINLNSTKSALLEPEEEVGVCLHVSKHRVSLEFCPHCCESVKNSWSG